MSEENESQQPLRFIGTVSLADSFIDKSERTHPMAEPGKRSHEEKVHRDDLRDERLNPGKNDVELGAGADLADQKGGTSARELPLDSTDAQQAGTQRDPKFKPEDSSSIG